MIQHCRAGEQQTRFAQRAVDVLALAGSLPVVERGEDRQSAVVRSAPVQVEVPPPRRWIRRRHACHLGQAREGLGHGRRGQEVGVEAALAEPGLLYVDDGRIDASHALVGRTERLQSMGCEVLDHYVTDAHQIVEYLDAAFCLQVQTEASFARVDLGERAATVHAVGPAHDDGLTAQQALPLLPHGDATGCA